jgi:AcrR family transcriptional regulator
MTRRERTERHILDALQAQIAEAGMGGVGINAVAKRAGVSKELIYRYFDGMPGLLLAWMKEQDFWTSPRGLLLDEEAGEKSPSDLVLLMLRAQIEALAGNETLREVRRWELIERNEVSSQLAARRERAARGFIDRIDGLTPEMDVPAVVSVMLAGVLYLMLRAKTESEFLGVPLRTDEGWKRFHGALDYIARGFPESLRTETLASLEKAMRPAAAAPGGANRKP